MPTVHGDLAADAMSLPFPDASIDNIVMQDVLHHIPFPLRFRRGPARARAGGRIVMTEPYISPASRIIFAVGHPVAGRAVSPDFRRHTRRRSFAAARPGAFASNQAVPTRLFFRDRRLFQQRFPHLRIVARRRRSLFVYPLSGGFSGPRLVPHALVPLGWAIEKLLTPFAPLMACRLLVVLEKSPTR